MEPGHEDREYAIPGIHAPVTPDASMEPGHEDREYTCTPTRQAPHKHASMEPGHEDREYLHPFAAVEPALDRLNGARS